MKIIGAVMLFTAFHGANATAILTIGDSRELGFVDAGLPAGDGNVTAYVNQLIGMSLGATTTVGGNVFTRSTNFFSPLDQAVLSSRTTYGSVASDTVTIDLTSGGFEYLLAKYDGPNYGSEVWYIGGLTGSLSIPSTGGRYGISGTSLFTKSTGTTLSVQSVPDHGTTFGMFASVLLGMVALRRRLAPAA